MPKQKQENSLLTVINKPCNKIYYGSKLHGYGHTDMDTETAILQYVIFSKTQIWGYVFIYVINTKYYLCSVI